MNINLAAETILRIAVKEDSSTPCDESDQLCKKYFGNMPFS